MGAPVLAASSHAMPSLAAHDGDISPPPHIVSRMTKGKRMLWYCLKVIQQPERARACGSGPKSSADRRPVDPPPVVELRIYEGDTWDRAQNKDITFLYNANFFLYATLEHARVMAHGRVSTPAANSPPILTGMPVSGMAYLDRPQEAGYFLFPDLSVRHEGRYRLTFNLYEETKEDEDKDLDAPDSKPGIPGISSATGGSFDFRMEVKSQDFVVYSAKKFPGLTESTALSRVVAEQGCRVRIRRDVRMRRRDGKGGGGGGDYDNAEDEYARRRRTATPDTRPDPYRARSLSGSVERTPYSADGQRRPSIAEYSPQYATQPPPPPGGHLQFLGGNSNSQYPSQPQTFAQPPSVPASPGYPPTQSSSYPGPPSYTSLPPPPPPPPAPQQPMYHQERTPTQPYAPHNPSPRREGGFAQDYRGPGSGITLPPLNFPPMSHGPPPAHKAEMLPPLQVDIPMSNRLPGPVPSPTTHVPRPNMFPPPPPPAPVSAPISRPPPPPQYAGTKRAHDETFQQDQEPHYNGAREGANGKDAEELKEMKYQRADGTIWTKTPPPDIVD
ncbi:velvet factor-domain-containing protein [Echria macrotheca]|uniref:Velvet factor-domain-containing protein n=1 Tax=Echria macrotheca TaxID=438768 RepID=A0AAJ0B1L3_9PEZI|nr:velvet factor-domain-containing protein [Echria macrotheca]